MDNAPKEGWPVLGLLTVLSGSARYPRSSGASVLSLLHATPAPPDGFYPKREATTDTSHTIQYAYISDDISLSPTPQTIEYAAEFALPRMPLLPIVNT